ncbi:NUDIX domain-containing protein [Pedobacter sp.]|uniref:NUDIX domain-containing protein n=1 Tax=Pedobacter sp. TaxID=1411316 RepID=UPI0031E3A91F
MKTSAGILLYRIQQQLEVFLVHPGGPFWKNKDIGAWSIPKGEYTAEADPLATAKREFKEETGQNIEGDFIPLNPIKQKGGKLVSAWAVQGNIDADNIVSNHITIPWPPRTGKLIEIPEVDQGKWFDTATALTKINPAQASFIQQLIDRITHEQ